MMAVPVSNDDYLCSEAGLHGIIDALILLHEQDTGTKACHFVIAGSFPAKLLARGAPRKLRERLRFNDVDVFYAHEWTPCSLKSPGSDHIEPGFIECCYRSLVSKGDTVEHDSTKQIPTQKFPTLAIVPPSDGAPKLTDVNFIRRYDYVDFAHVDVEEFVNTKIDINAVKVGVKVAADAQGHVDLLWSQNVDFEAFISTGTGVEDTFGVLRVPDLRLTTHPANSILRVLVKANAMGLPFALPSRAELKELERDGVLRRMLLMNYHMAAWESLPQTLKHELEDLGLVFLPATVDADDARRGVGGRLVEMRFVDREGK